MNSPAWLDAEFYTEVLRCMPVCTVDVALFNSDLTRALLFRRANEPLKGEWYTLGGRLRKNETLQECALRQARSEAGLNLDPARLFFGAVVEEFLEHPAMPPGEGVHCLNICFGYVLADDSEVHLDAQHREARWHTLDGLSGYPSLIEKLTRTRDAR